MSLVCLLRSPSGSVYTVLLLLPPPLPLSVVFSIVMDDQVARFSMGIFHQLLDSFPSRSCQQWSEIAFASNG